MIRRQRVKRCFLHWVAALAALTAVLPFSGCATRGYYQDRSVEKARAFLLKKCPDMPFYDQEYIKFNRPVLLTAPITRNYATGLSQFCVTWLVPDNPECYMVFGASDTRMLSWDPVRVLRKNFERTSNALIRYIPAAVVIVDAGLIVTEANARFAELAGVADIYEAIGGVSGMHIAKTLPQLEPLFRTVLGGETDITRYRQHYGDRIVNVSVFPIAKGKFAGAVLQDVTGNEFKREQVSERAREVIRKNVITVQEVARLFGEHIAETEIMLNEIAGTYESSGDPVKLRNSVMSSDGIND